MHKFTLAFILICLAVLLTACSLASDITPPPGSVLEPPRQATEVAPADSVFPILPPDLENGSQIYRQKCAPCHGVSGLGDGPQADKLAVPVANLAISSSTNQSTPADWYTVVTQGNMEKFMPPFSSLTDRQRWDVVAYAMSLGTSADLIARGKIIYQENCAGCHGLTGKGDGPDAAQLPSAPSDYTDQSLMAQTSADDLFQAISSGITPHMPAFESILEENERWAVVDYIRSLTFAPPASSGNAYPAPVDNVDSAPLDTYPAPQSDPGPTATQLPEILATSEVSPTAPFMGTVSVQLINGSGGQAPSDANVTLYGFDDMQTTYSDTLTTGVDGIYAFTDVPMPEGRVFLAGTDYASAAYGSDIAPVDPANPNLQLQVTVYDSTTDASVLTTDRVHIFFDFSDPQNAQVIEVFIISNPTNQAVVSSSEGGSVVTFPLPEGYTNLQFQDGQLGDRYVEVEGGFADTMSVKPGVGEYQVIFAFQIPYDRKLDFAQTMSLSTSAVVVMVPQTGVKVSGSQLQDAGVRDFQGTTYQMYEAANLLAGSALEFTLSGKPTQAAAPVVKTGSSEGLAIGLGVFGIAFIAGGLWLFFQNRKKKAILDAAAGQSPGEAVPPVDSLADDEDTLMDAIIALDDQYHAGNLPEEAYLQRRVELKEKLRKINQG